MNKEKISVLFQPSGRRGEVEPGKTILQAAQELGVAVESLCGGKSTCGKCKVRVEEGCIPRARILSLFSPEESQFIERRAESGIPLACVARL